jgi:hypothetical protein
MKNDYGKIIVTQRARLIKLDQYHQVLKGLRRFVEHFLIDERQNQESLQSDIIISLEAS